MQSRFKSLVSATILTTACFSTSVFADKSDLEAEIKHYSEVLSGGSFPQHREAFGDMEWLAISDPRVFDAVEKKVLENYLTDDKRTLDEVSWYIKGLALSGNQKYQATIDKVLADDINKKLRKHATIAKERIADRMMWNPIIAKDLEKAPNKKTDMYRVLNMLNSDIPELQRAGAKRIYYHYTNENMLFEASKAALESRYKTETDKLWADALAWHCKALGISGKPEYKTFLEDVQENAAHKTVRKYAAKALKDM